MIQFRALIAELPSVEHKSGADKETFDQKGRTPLHRAVDAGRLDVARFLLEARARKAFLLSMKCSRIPTTTIIIAIKPLLL